jgi:hypothetical protein
MLGAIIDSVAEAMTEVRLSRHSHENVVHVKRQVTHGHNVRVVVTYKDHQGNKRSRCFLIAALEAAR